MNRESLIRLTLQSDSSGQSTTIRIDGRVDAQSLRELEASLASQSGHAVALDLSGVSWLDDAGRDLLLRFRRGGGRLIGGSLFIKHMLEEAPKP